MTGNKPKKHNSVPCLFPGCESLSYARGLCPNHYMVAKRRVASGKSTWHELVMLKLAIEPEKKMNEFDAIIDERRNDLMKKNPHA